MAVAETFNSIYSDQTNSLSPKLKIYIKNGYNYLISNSIHLLIIPTILSTAIYHLSALDFPQIVTVTKILISYRNSHPHLAIICLFSALMAIIYILSVIARRKHVYLVDFACYKHDPCFLISRETFFEKLGGCISPESLAFCEKVMERSGVSDKFFTYGTENFPPKSSFECAREEAEIVLSGAVDDVLEKTGVNPRDIGVVIVNISTFNPVPSLSAMIVNRHKLREDVLSYNLGGMGCSAGLIAIDLAKRLLQVGHNTYALVVSLESATAGHYVGEDRSKLLSNCLFRMGAAAILLSNHPSDRRSSKYELKHTLRTHLGADDKAYNCVMQEVDKDARVGISITKDVSAVAGEALKKNISSLGPLVLPISEQLIFLAALIARKVFKKKGVKPYVPDFKLAFEHFCIHAGGKAVLDEVERNLKLTKWDMEPSRMTLYRYSNTSSSSLWYELAYAEAKGRVKKGDRVWQIAFGSGFKCASGVWRALRTIDPSKEDNPWIGIIDQFPVT
ncbi:Very-long-chain 3-oxoacyl-CoA synthase [Handroanthus impetiginosus]|uniref:3-ketoacyl-CoA synthase n=1 Tax=Handroanthus impetiginosus TaxID=429701 RepID=A0A2G9GG75_9LAMI|nr:Very-long-chain 3-oxoacyl-CoA synthase [Handroanthus impetiginosus]